MPTATPLSGEIAGHSVQRAFAPPARCALHIRPRPEPRSAPAMTPRLCQAIALLPLTASELNAFVAQQWRENPLLLGAEEEEGEAWGDSPPFSPTTDGAGVESGAYGWTVDALPERKTLHNHLLEQLALERFDRSQQEIALHLIDRLDECGWLRGDPAALARQLERPVAAVEAVLARLREFEPAGVFSRDLAECWAVQLRDRGRLDGPMRRLLDRLPLLAEGGAVGARALCRLCGVGPERLAAMRAELRALAHAPAQSGDETRYIRPDVIVRIDGAGRRRVELAEGATPRVRINEAAYAALHAPGCAATDRFYATERRREARWLARALERRADAILRVAQEIVRRQAGFFRHGVDALLPLTRREIAVALDFHESTVSRAVQWKYMATPRGLFELNYFFSAGAEYAPLSLRHRIEQLVDGEEAGRPLSDRAIAARLGADGIEIARRTVAKYRRRLSIPTAARRARSCGAEKSGRRLRKV